MDKWEKIPKELQAMKNWVGVKEGSKIPLNPIYDQTASVADPDTWGEFKDVYSLIKQKEFDYAGFIFNNSGYVGIDIDQAYDEYGYPNDLCIDIINTCRSYTEKSKSGRGFHIILKGDLPFLGKNNRQGLEIYKDKRYFIMTADTFLYSDIIANQEAIDTIISKYFDNNSIQDDEEKSVFQNAIYKPTWQKSKDSQKINIKAIYQKIEQGSRNISLLSLAGLFVNLEWSADTIYKKLSEVNLKVCKPPLSDNEIINIVRSIERYRR